MTSIADRELANISGKIEILGKRPFFDGPYSNIYRGNYDGQMVAVKVLKPVGRIHAMRRKIHRERAVWGALDHPNILPCIGYAEDDEQFEPFGALISPWCTNGDITKFLEEYGSEMSLDQRIAMWKGVVEGVYYLHQFDPIIVHGDLKPANVLLDDNLTPRICDFGLARIILEEGNSGTTTTTIHTGTERYLAYELVVSDDIALPTAASDVHALGCMGLDVIFLQSPYSHRRSNIRNHIFRDIGEGVPPAPCPNNLYGVEARCWNIISSCWGRDPAARPDTRALLSSLHIDISLSTENVTPDDIRMDVDEATLEDNIPRHGTSGISGSTFSVQVNSSNRLASSYEDNFDSLEGHVSQPLGTRTALKLADIAILSTDTGDEEKSKERPKEQEWGESQVAPYLSRSRSPSGSPPNDWHPTEESPPTEADRRGFERALEGLDKDHYSIVVYYGGNTFWTRRLVLQKILEYYNAKGNWPMRVERTGTRANARVDHAECAICDRGHFQKLKVQQIAKHLTSEEWRLKPWRCMFCSAAYSHNDGSLKAHMKRVHGKEENDVRKTADNAPGSALLHPSMPPPSTAVGGT
ncbi:hypothetical protein FRC18_004471 [Serendipita sp. 400]|nr:hypothetical protein FRC18_004471 [Serendipita sp. 400]